MKITYISVNGKQYAYSNTSVRVPGKDKPVSKRKYLGRVNQETGEIIPPKQHKVGPTDSSFDIVDYGESKLLMHIAKRIGIVDDLNELFPDTYLTIMALAIAMSAEPAHITKCVENTRLLGIWQTLGLKTPSMKDVVNHLQKIDYDSFKNLMELRIKRNKGTGAIYHGTTYIHDMIHMTPSKTPEKMDILIRLDGHGLPAGLTISDSRLSGDLTLELANKHLQYDDDCILLSDSHDFNIDNLAEVASMGRRFVVIAYDSSDLFEPFQTEFIDIDNRTHAQDWTSITHQIKQIDVSLTLSEERWKLEPNNTNGYRCNAYVCFSPDTVDVNINRMKDYLLLLKESLEGRGYDDPEKQIVTVAGNLAYFFKYHINPDGSLNIVIDNKLLKKHNQHYGQQVILTSESNLELVKTLFEKKLEIVSATDYIINSLRIPSGKTSYLFPPVGSLMIGFVAMILNVEIQYILSAQSSKMTVDDVHRIASSWRAMYSNGVIIRGKADREVRKLFKIFGAADGDEMVPP